MTARHILPLLLLACSCMAQQVAPEPRQKTEEVSGPACVKLSLQAARSSIGEAEKRFAASDTKTAHQAMDAALHDLDHAVECSLTAPRSQKGTEIELRRISRRLEAMTKTLEAEEHPYLEGARAEVEKQRDRLLHAMFGDAANPPEKKH